MSPSDELAIGKAAQEALARFLVKERRGELACDWLRRVECPTSPRCFASFSWLALFPLIRISVSVWNTSGSCISDTHHPNLVPLELAIYKSAHLGICLAHAWFGWCLSGHRPSSLFPCLSSRPVFLRTLRSCIGLQCCRGHPIPRMLFPPSWASPYWMNQHTHIQGPRCRLF